LITADTELLYNYRLLLPTRPKFNSPTDMRFTLTTLLIALFAAIAMAVTPQLYDVIISVPNDAPKGTLEEAKEKVRNTEGAEITHEYSELRLNGWTASCWTLANGS
jgi:hypothetical protein